MTRTQELVIDKQKAEEWLRKNLSNRNISKRHVDFLKMQMDAGDWTYAADPIRFAGNFDRLLDGQHRLTAFVESKMEEMRVLVVSGLSETAFDNMDTGRPRNAGDLLYTLGYDSGRRIAAAIKMINLIERGSVGLKAKGGHGEKNKFSTTNHEVKVFAETNPSIVDVCKQGERWYSEFPVLKPAEYSAFYFIFSKKDADMALDFFSAFAKGANLSESSPVFVLRKKMEQNKLSTSKMIGKMKQSLIIQAWNLYRQGKEAKILRFSPGDNLPGIL